MSDTSQGPGWWQASDGKWYPPEQAPGRGGPTPTAAEGVDIGGALSYGWNKFTQNLGPLLVATLLIWAGHAVLNGGANFVVESLVVRTFWSLVVTVIIAVLTMGLTQVSLKIVRGEPVDISDALPSGPMLVPYTIAAIVADLVIGIGFGLCVIPGLLIAPLFMFTHFVVLDEGLQPGDALARSIALGRASYGGVLGFVIVAFLVNVVGFLLCCVGLFATIPLTTVAAASVYRGLKGEPVAA